MQLACTVMRHVAFVVLVSPHTFFAPSKLCALLSLGCLAWWATSVVGVVLPGGERLVVDQLV